MILLSWAQLSHLGTAISMSWSLAVCLASCCRILGPLKDKSNKLFNNLVWIVLYLSKTIPNWWWQFWISDSDNEIAPPFLWGSSTNSVNKISEATYSLYVPSFVSTPYALSQTAADCRICKIKWWKEKRSDLNVYYMYMFMA